MRENNIEQINKAISSFNSVIDNFFDKLELVKKEDFIKTFDKISLHSFFEPFLSDYCIDKIKAGQISDVKNLSNKIEELLIKYPGSYIENGIAVSFLEALWGNNFEFHELYIRLSGKFTLELTLLVNKRFNHEEKSRRKILMKLEKIN